MNVSKYLQKFYETSNRERHWVFPEDTPTEQFELCVLFHALPVQTSVEVIRRVCDENQNAVSRLFDTDMWMVQDSDKRESRGNREKMIWQITLSLLDAARWMPNGCSEKGVYWPCFEESIKTAHALIFNSCSAKLRVSAVSPLMGLTEYSELRLGEMEPEKMPEEFGALLFWHVGLDFLNTYKILSATANTPEFARLHSEHSEAAVRKVTQRIMQYCLLWPMDVTSGRVQLSCDDLQYMRTFSDIVGRYSTNPELFAENIAIAING